MRYCLYAGLVAPLSFFVKQGYSPFRLFNLGEFKDSAAATLHARRLCRHGAIQWSAVVQYNVLRVARRPDGEAWGLSVEELEGLLAGRGVCVKDRAGELLLSPPPELQPGAGAACGVAVEPALQHRRRLYNPGAAWNDIPRFML